VQFFDEEKDGIKYLRLNIEDDYRENIIEYLDESVDFMKAA
jgi:protein-tyrosine phosphatase